MLPLLRNRFEFIITYLLPLLLLLTDALLRIGMNIDVGDAGADMAFATVTGFMTLLLADLRTVTLYTTPQVSVPTRDPKDFAIIFVLAIVFGILWLITLLILSKASLLGKPLSTSLAIVVGLTANLAGTRLFYNFMYQETN